MDTTEPRAHHDLGGVSRFLCEPVDTEPHALTDFDREVDALRQILGGKRVVSVDELRRGIEAIPEETYHQLSYYRRWIRSLADNLIRKGVVTEAELRAALDAAPMTGDAPAAAAGFPPGAKVRVRNDWPESRGPVHVRTPHYLRGRPGTVLRRLGAFPNPEDLAFARPAATLPLYHVAFERDALWPDGRAGDTVLVEIYEPWLEPRQ